jgi:hypothetical protein
MTDEVDLVGAWDPERQGDEGLVLGPLEESLQEHHLQTVRPSAQA